MTSSSCPFCQRARDGDYDDVYFEGEAMPLSVSFEPLNPVTRGHRLFLPTRHITHATEHPGYVSAVFRHALQWASALLEDYNLILNQGANASQTIGHLHIHYVPRQHDDGLHLPWTGQHVA